MYRRRRRPVASLLCVLFILPTTSGAVADDGTGVGAGRGTRRLRSPTMRFVANVRYPSSTDIELGEFTVPLLGPDGQPACELDAAGACVVEENGEIVYRTEVRDYLFAGSLNAGVRVIDVTDPEAPFLVTTIACNAFPADIQIRPDLGLLAVGNDPNASTCGPAGVILFDVSDPRSPEKVSKFAHAAGAHTLTFHPKAPLLYLSEGDVIPGTQAARLPVVDVSDPREPKMVASLTWLAHSPHDITFNASGSRAYAASISRTDILDTSDPRAPQVISSIHDPAINIHHQADPSPDGKTLFITDEITPYTQGIDPQCPGGAVHVFDISTESLPVRAGIFVAEDTMRRPICKPHVFQLLPDGKTLVISWHSAGVRVVDVSDPDGLGPTEAGHLIATGMGGNEVAAESVAARWYKGYIYSSDLRRGLDVMQWVPGAA